MSDNIPPLEMQLEILKRLPVKSVIKLRCVCKAWKSLSQSSDFIANYNSHHTRVQHLLVRYGEIKGDSHSGYHPSIPYKYVSIVDDHTFPRHKVSLTVPTLVSMLKSPSVIGTSQAQSVIGTSQGLLCLCGIISDTSTRKRTRHDTSATMRTIVLWNLSLGKAVAVIVRNVPIAPPNVTPYKTNNTIYNDVIGFGVCRVTNDPKIVKITYIDRLKDIKDMESIDSIPWQVEVFTLSKGAWRRPCCTPPRTSLRFIDTGLSVDVDGVLYWLARYRRITMDGKFMPVYSLIVSFDMTTEEFREVNLPDELAYRSWDRLTLYKLGESLCVLENDKDVVWKLEDVVTKSFTKLFTVESPYASYSYLFVRGFRKTGEAIIELETDFSSPPYRPRDICVYEAASQRITNLGIKEGRNSYSVYAYMETLLLLDQPESIIY